MRNVIDDPKHQKQLAALRRDMHEFFRRHEAPPLADWRTTTQQKIPTIKRISDGRQSP